MDVFRAAFGGLTQDKIAIADGSLLCGRPFRGLDRKLHLQEPPVKDGCCTTDETRCLIPHGTAISTHGSERLWENVCIASYRQVSSADLDLFRSVQPNRPIRTSAIGFQAGQNAIFSRFVRSLLTVPLVFAGLSTHEAAARLDQLLQEFNFAHLLERDYLTLSGGERQFVALFSCLLSEVDLYMLDDPVVMMDQERAAKTISIIKEFFSTENNRIGAVTSVRPADYCGLPFGNTVHLGYSPNPSRCLEEFDALLASLQVIEAHRSMVVLDNLTISPFGRTLLRNESNCFRSGELALITGANGCGKTCILHALAGISRPHFGSIAVLDTNQEAVLPAVGKNCVYLPQQFLNLVGFETIAEELGTRTAPLWWRKILEFLFDWRILHPELRVPESSLGERHFCNILAALSAGARQPTVKVLLLDEPDSGLDDLHCRLLIRIFHWLAAQHWTVVIVSHRPHLYRLAPIATCVKEFVVADQHLALREVAG